MYDLHGLIKIGGSHQENLDRIVDNCRVTLGVEYCDGEYQLNWPMKALIAVK